MSSNPSPPAPPKNNEPPNNLNPHSLHQLQQQILTQDPRPYINPTPEFESRLRAAARIFNEGAQLSQRRDTRSMRETWDGIKYTKARKAFLYAEYNAEDAERNITPHSAVRTPASSSDGEENYGEEIGNASLKRLISETLITAYLILFVAENVNWPCYLVGNLVAVSTDAVSWWRGGRQGGVLGYWTLDYYCGVVVSVMPYGLWCLGVGIGIVIWVG